MATERLDTSEKIVRMTEWNEAEAWTYGEEESKVRDSLARAKRFVAAQAFLLSWQEGKIPTGWRRPRRLGDFDGKYGQHVLDKVEETIAERIQQRNLQKTKRINEVLSIARGAGTTAAAAAATAAATTATTTTAAVPSPSPSPSPSPATVPATVTATATATADKAKAKTKVKVVDKVVVDKGNEQTIVVQTREKLLKDVKNDFTKFSRELAEAKMLLKAASDLAAESTLRVEALTK